MSDEIRTPRGRVLRLETTFENGWREYGIANDATLRVSIRGDRVSAYSPTDQFDGTIEGCCAFLDARADETVAALLPPGAIVVTEERVREAVETYMVPHVASRCRENVPSAMARLLSALRAGAKS